MQREHEQATFLPLRDHESLREFVPKPRRQEEPALLVEPRGVGAEKHTAPPPLDPVAHNYRRAPLGATIPHFPPPATQTTLRLAGSRRIDAGQEMWRTSGARHGPAGRRRNDSNGTDPADN